MKTINYTTMRKQFAKTLDSIYNDNNPIIVTKGNNQAVVLISLEDYSYLTEKYQRLQPNKATISNTHR